MSKVRRYRFFDDEVAYHGTFDALILYDYDREEFYLVEVYYSYDLPILVQMLSADLELQKNTRPENPFNDDVTIIDYMKSTFELFKYYFVDNRRWLRNYVVYIIQDLILF